MAIGATQFRPLTDEFLDYLCDYLQQKCGDIYDTIVLNQIRAWSPQNVGWRYLSLYDEEDDGMMTYTMEFKFSSGQSYMEQQIVDKFIELSIIIAEYSPALGDDTMEYTVAFEFEADLDLTDF